MFLKRILIICLSFMVALTGCNNPVYNQTEANIADATQRIMDARHQSNEAGKPQPTLTVNEGMYVDRTPISLAKEPTWLRNKIILRGDQLPFSYYSRTIAGGGGRDVLTNYQVGLDQAALMSLNYTGTVRGALDLLAAKTGYVYTVNGRRVYWQAFVTKTFDVAFMPGRSDYQMGKSSSGGGSGTAPGAASPASNGSVTNSGIVDDNTAQEYSNLKGSLSVWKDLKDSITEMLSPDGKVMVSESTTSVTVRDKPSNVSLIGKFIANMNRNLSKQVLVKVEVLDVNLSTAFNYGIDWSAVKVALGNQFFLQANYGTPVSIAPLVSTPSFVNGVAGLPQFGTLNNSSTGVTALVNALTQQGKVAVVTQPRVVCLNNQVSVIRITQQQGYLASVQTTALASGTSTTINNNTVTSQITPGNVVTGLTLYILPKIMGNKIFLQVNADLSNLISIQNISSQGSGTATAGSTAPIIQVPQLSQKQFNQRAVIGSGDTLILSGFRSVSNQTGAMQLLTSQDLGGKAAQQANLETIVLITPIVLSGSA